MLINKTITIFHKTGVEYVAAAVPAWVQHKRERVTEKTGDNLTSTVHVSVYPIDISPGDYVMLSEVFEGFAEADLKKFIEKNKPHKVYYVFPCSLPGGAVHHIEAVCV